MLPPKSWTLGPTARPVLVTPNSAMALTPNTALEPWTSKAGMVLKFVVVPP